MAISAASPHVHSRLWVYMRGVESSPSMQDGPANQFLQAVDRQFQSCTSAQTNPTPDLALTPTLWGAS